MGEIWTLDRALRTRGPWAASDSHSVCSISSPPALQALPFCIRCLRPPPFRDRRYVFTRCFES